MLHSVSAAKLVLRSTDQSVDGEWKINDPAPRALSERDKRSTLLKKGDLVVTKSSGSSLHIGKTTLVSEEVEAMNCCFGNFMQRLRTKLSLLPKLAWYIMNNSIARLQLDLLSNSTTGLANINGTVIGEIILSMPPVDEQATIAAFLDHETARIDALVEEQQRLIELLKEKRQAVISHAVMDHGDGRKGKLGHYVDLLPGYAFPSSGFHQEGVRLLRGANIGVGEVDWNETVYWPEDKTEGLDDYKLRVGDLVFGMDRPWIKKGSRVSFVGEKDLPAYVLQRVARLRAKKGLEQCFLRLILVSKEFRDYVEVDMTGVSVPHVSPEQICAFKISLPRQNKQIEICREVSMGLSRLASLIATAESSISLMQERRSALISAAVTGKIDVRGWQADRQAEPEDALMAAEPRATYQ
ncbi:restriction endonuclease subunit S [Halomonas piscis]|uniref:restriction endonuclease subunit S n=1 Tax=Halomonas piscis TaxID=3031727 RepID=UPI00289A8D6E|nr:restriction endonuclease subunit S [Halomonas piscis]